MTSLLRFFRLTAWAIGLGILASQLIYRTDVPDGVLVAAASAVLMWRVVVAMDLPMPSRAAEDPAPYQSLPANRGA